MNASDFRRIALSLNGAEEGSHMGSPDFRVGGRIFATLASQDQGYGNLMLTPEQQREFVSEQPEIFVPIAGGWGRMGATHVRLAKANEDVLTGALRTAWKLRREKNVKAGGKKRSSAVRAFALLVLLSPTIVVGHAAPTEPVPQESQPAQTKPPAQTPNPSQKSIPEAPSSIIDPNEKILHQTPRILGVLPNFTAVDSNTRLPRLSTRAKFVIAMHDSVDYSSFLLVAALAGKGLSSNAIPALGTGAAGFGRYYWRQFTDQVSGTFFTEAIFPTLTHEDPRYYTLGKKGFFKRASYAITRTIITPNDRGTNEFNISEIAGNASEAALSNLYYPAAERGFGKSAKNFATQTVITALANVLKEFWPDIRKNILRIKDESPARP